ncbi:MAG: universal stress protein [Hyphomicrobiaceae bacterium]|nr:universal stress protein [Hyphomicrobiaceae bacterium]
MTTTYLVAIDGSEGSLRAANFATERAKASSAKLVLAYVIEWSPYSFNTPEENAERHQRREEEIERAQTTVLDPVSQTFRDKGVGVATEVRHGHAAETLVDLAKEHGAAQIFIGRKGESRMKTLLFGSVAGTLVQMSPIPVTVVP